MTQEFAVEFAIRKGLGPDTFRKTISVGLDDLPDDVTPFEIREYAVGEAESELRRSEDYKYYGKNWTVVDVQRT